MTEEEINELKRENYILRKMAFLNHTGYDTGHHGYHDDGELQCATCGIDFKRDSVDEMARKNWARTIKDLEKLQAEGKVASERNV